MKLPLTLLFPLACLVILPCRAQDAMSPSLNIGDPAPQLRLCAWLKGRPFQQFQKGKVYVVEFWATWCAPCKASMPHLSSLAAKYKDRVTFLGVDIYEKRTTSIRKIKALVDSMGDRMAFDVATEDSNFMETGWIGASGVQRGIPLSFVIDTRGRLAWIGKPNRLDEVLPGIVDHTWDIKAALAKWDRDRHLRELDDSMGYEFARFSSRNGDPPEVKDPDSVFRMIAKMVKIEPGLRYAPAMAQCTFYYLLKSNPQKAYDYGRRVMVTATYEDDPPYEAISNAISALSDSRDIPAQVYLLGAEALQAQIDHFPYPGIRNFSKDYHTMADWYRRGGNRSKALEAERKATPATR